jgi:undecaprenyl-diphosphatase
LVKASREGRRGKIWLATVSTLYIATLTGSLLLDGAVAKLISMIHTPSLTAAMSTLTNLGDFSLLVLVVSCVYAMGLRSGEDRGRRIAIPAALALFTTGILVLLLKLLTARGPEGGFHWLWGWDTDTMMFPSGHAALVCAVSVVLGRVYQALRWPLFVIVLVVAMSRVYLDYHFFSDVIAGLLLGLAVSSLILRYAGNVRLA